MCWRGREGLCVSVGVQVLEELQPGTLGTMLVVELKAGKGAKKKYVIKQVECIEESQANEALKEVSVHFFLTTLLTKTKVLIEQSLLSTRINLNSQDIDQATDLLKLHHSNICAYQELFVTWDNEVIMKFLGQMVDALFYMHKQSIFHRYNAELLTSLRDVYVCCLSENDYEPTTALLLDALRMNPERPVLVKNTFLALASLLRLSEIPALRFIMDPKGNGINLIKYAYHLHFDHPEVVENICVLISEMLQYVYISVAEMEVMKYLTNARHLLRFGFCALAEGDECVLRVHGPPPGYALLLLIVTWKAVMKKYSRYSILEIPSLFPLLQLIPLLDPPVCQKKGTVEIQE
ncbi:hypothetical protein llap_14512 [Limosa lapponica baueri]|uniref:non-specific serine/threonine protein kinase n=1 Tax=Limosa lapponica baueri TaxID=1758121 RepID=A0A2I0TN07_LIMLA|nr:hypothetical protein llap_14512 [Limosa lapponica baueri]